MAIRPSFSGRAAGGKGKEREARFFWFDAAQCYAANDSPKLCPLALRCQT